MKFFVIIFYFLFLFTSTNFIITSCQVSCCAFFLAVTVFPKALLVWNKRRHPICRVLFLHVIIMKKKSHMIYKQYEASNVLEVLNLCESKYKIRFGLKICIVNLFLKITNKIYISVRATTKTELRRKKSVVKRYRHLCLQVFECQSWRHDLTTVFSKFDFRNSPEISV